MLLRLLLSPQTQSNRKVLQQQLLLIIRNQGPQLSRLKETESHQSLKKETGDTRPYFLDPIESSFAAAAGPRRCCLTPTLGALGLQMFVE